MTATEKFELFMDDYFDGWWINDKSPNGDYKDQSAYNMFKAFLAGRSEGEEKNIS